MLLLLESRPSLESAANLIIIACLFFYGFALFAEYHARGRWSKNVTALLAGLGMIVLALALVLTPDNAATIATIARSSASDVLLGISSGLLLAAILAYGVIAYAKPFRLWHERKIERDLSRELPKIP